MTDDDDDFDYHTPRSMCSNCGQRVGPEPGEPAPIHTLPGEHRACAGSGQPTNQMNGTPQ